MYSTGQVHPQGEYTLSLLYVNPILSCLLPDSGFMSFRSTLRLRLSSNILSFSSAYLWLLSLHNSFRNDPDWSPAHAVTLNSVASLSYPLPLSPGEYVAHTIKVILSFSFPYDYRRRTRITSNIRTYIMASHKSASFPAAS